MPPSAPTPAKKLQLTFRRRLRRSIRRMGKTPSRARPGNSLSPNLSPANNSPRLGDTPYDLPTPSPSTSSATPWSPNPSSTTSAARRSRNFLRALGSTTKSLIRMHLLISAQRASKLRGAGVSPAVQPGCGRDARATNFPNVSAYSDTNFAPAWCRSLVVGESATFNGLLRLRRHPKIQRSRLPLCRDANIPVALATLRIIKPGVEGLLRQIADCAPDAILVRNLAAVSYYKEIAPRPSSNRRLFPQHRQ